jgi:hypothetical protein
MKKFLLFPLLVFMTALVVPACSDDDKDELDNNDKTEETTKYNGTLIVNGHYKKENTDCEIIFDEQKEKLTMTIFQVKFAENMPLTLDISLQGIPCNATNEMTTFSGNDIVPMMGEVPVPAYTFSNIEGSIKDDTDLIFSATLTKGTFTFNGKKVVE